MNIIPQLNLNKHPKDCKCNSLVNANNIRLSNDGSCLQSEESIRANNVINNYLNEVNPNGDIIGIIPCNKELVIFYTKPYNNRNQYVIIRYNEDSNSCKQYYNQEYDGGVIKGDFTYNSLNELIIAFCESNDETHKLVKDSPLKTVNLGEFNSDYEHLFNDNLVLNPSPSFTTFESFNYINGIAKKGWYTLFIRYKIDSNNYTQWYPFGYTFYLNSIEERSIIKLYSTMIPIESLGQIKYIFASGCTDYISTDDDISNITAGIIYDVEDDVYSYHQIGWICSNKTSTKAYKTSDIKTSTDRNEFVLSYNNAEEYNASDLLQRRSNYYNVKNINNYKNRLYIGNYNEHYDDKSYFTNYVNKIQLSVTEKIIDISKSHIQEINKTTICVNTNNELVIDNKSTIEYYDPSKTFKDRIANTTLIPGNLYKFYIHFVDLYGEETEGIEIPFNNITGFTKEEYNNKVYYRLNCPDVLYDEIYKVKQFILNINLSEDIDFPKDYITCFLSYEKIEQNQITGILCKYDFNDSSYGFDKPNDNHYHFYTEELDIKDKINLSFNKLRVDKKNIYNLSSLFVSDRTIALAKVFTPGETYGEDFADKIHNLNTIEQFEISDDIEYIDLDIDKIKFKLGGDGKNGRDGIGTCIEITDSSLNDLFPNLYTIHKVTLIGTPIISVNTKQLIKFTDYFHPTVTAKEIKGAYNGFITFNSALIYNANKNIFNDVNNNIYDTNGVYYTPSPSDPSKSLLDEVEYKLRKPLVNIQYHQYAETLFETKSFKKEPDAIVIIYDVEKNQNVQQPATKIGYYIKPINSIDLYKDEYGKLIDNVNNYYYSYNDNIKNLSTFTKVVRRSAVIGDESQVNAWRNFPVEEYTLINENKGAITNIIGLGNTLLVHTEHSLFMFNGDAKLRNTDGGDVQISNPDIFNVAYQEVFTSKLGTCGLQDSDAYIVDDFGYIFYDNDANKIYNFTSKSIEEIDEDIINWLRGANVHKIRFANDKESNRILLQLWYNGEDEDYDKITLSYNLLTKTFISIHNYKFDKSIRTKNKLYYLYNNKLYNINYSVKNREYNVFENSNNSEPVTNCISVIYNNQYELIKALEFITYKLYKSYDNNENLLAAAIKHKEPYSGNQLQVLNDLVDTSVIDIRIDSNEIKNLLNNWKKPYWDLGNWNFNYLRDTKHGSIADTMSRIYGNYFILNFIFGGTNVKYEFESLECAITKFR